MLVVLEVAEATAAEVAVVTVVLESVLDVILVEAQVVPELL